LMRLLKLAILMNFLHIFGTIRGPCLLFITLAFGEFFPIIWVNLYLF
jgi:hypothetical protein